MLSKKKKRNRPGDITIYLNGTTLTRVRAYCYLGVWLSKTMSWDEHVDRTITKASISLNLLQRLHGYFNKRVKLKITKLASDLYWSTSTPRVFNTNTPHENLKVYKGKP